ncbi:hypothetical protein PLICRDRAFT_152057 [Plicaturopsis crispa FD-325 SS-3]|nr:hypothetical protein PLICRDRAFT_152057 [Plicaturopsis crispa FD-325 SS-3]
MSTGISEAIPSKDIVLDFFDGFRQELDEFNDRRERLIKTSRDITNISKKTIFFLHRIVTTESDESDQVLAERAASEAYAKLREVQTFYSEMKEELQGDRFWRHHRQVSPGLQEYIEALSFAYYLQHGSLVPFNYVQSTVADTDGVPYFPLTMDDYLLGLSDLTGELMRFAITGIARRGGRTKASDVCAFVRRCKADFERFTPYVRELSKKQAVTGQSLEKIEDTAYAIVVRGYEYDLSPEALDDIVAQSVSAYGSPRDRRTQHQHDDDGERERMDID